MRLPGWESPCLAFLAASILAVTPAPTQAQDQDPDSAGQAVPDQLVRLSGRLVDADGEGVANQAVVLHKVTDGGGASLAQTTTDDEGRFTLEAGPTATDGLFFVATQAEGQLRIGPVLRAPFPDEEYVLSLAAPPVTAGPLPPGVGGPPPVPVAPVGATGRSGATGQLTFVIASILTLVAAAVWVVQHQRAPPERRRTLIRLAGIEEGTVEAGKSERAELLKRLR